MTANGNTYLLNVTETAKILGVHPNTIRHWVCRGLLNPIQIRGGQHRHSGWHRFEPDEVEALRASRVGQIAELWGTVDGRIFYRLKNWSGFYSEEPAGGKVKEVPEGAVCLMRDGEWTGNYIGSTRL